MAAAPSALGKKFKEELTCSICLELFTRPKVLPCQHTFCQDCLRDHAGKGETIKCPICRQQVRLPSQGVPGLPDNHMVTSLCVALQKQATLSEKAELSKAVNRCGFHPSEKLKIYCKPCQMPICVLCLEEAHEDHRTTTINKYAQERKSTVQALINEGRDILESYCGFYRGLGEEEKALNEQIHQTKNNIIQAYDQIVQKIAEQKDRLLAEAEQNKTKNLESIEKERDVVLAHVNKLSAACDRGEQEMERGGLSLLSQEAVLTGVVEKYRGKSAPTPVQMQPALFLQPTDTLVPILGHVMVQPLSTAPIPAAPAARGTDNHHGNQQRQSVQLLQPTPMPSALAPISAAPAPIPPAPAQNPEVPAPIPAAPGPIPKAPALISASAPMPSAPAPIPAAPEAKGTGHHHGNQRQSYVESLPSAPITAALASSTGNDAAGGTDHHHGNQRKGGHQCQRVTFGGERSGTGQFNGPRAVAVSGEGEIFVLDWANQRIQVFTLEAKFVRQFPTLVPGAQKMNPHDVAIDGEGNLWVVGNIALFAMLALQYDKHGNILKKIDLQFTSKYKGVAVDPIRNHIIITQTKRRGFGNLVHTIGEVLVFRSDGSLIRTMGQKQGMKFPHYITVDREGRILVTDCDNHCVFVYNEDGRFLFKFGGEGNGEGRLCAPNGICTDKAGNIIVADSGNKCVEMFDKTGKFVKHIITDKRGPRAVAMAMQGQLVVTFWNHTVSVLQNY
ncbi:uncharacterized protein LOC144877920 [Branchiostoma floridae x Branchiostoma japonicum]